MAWAWRTRRKASKLGKYVPKPDGGFGGGWDTTILGGVDTPENLR